MKKIIRFFILKLKLRKYKIFNKMEGLYYRYDFYKFRIIKRIFKRTKKQINQHDIVELVLSDYPLIRSGMVTKDELRVILENLKAILDEDIPGNIVELGCNVGTTSLFIRKMLDFYHSQKEFHVYDSFEGLPEKGPEDIAEDSFFQQGTCRTQKEHIIFNFKKNNLKLPIIHVGWFAHIDQNEYPEKIAFAFFDGDFYSSITDSFKMVYSKLSSGARILIHDYQKESLPGVKKAVTDFVKGKPEQGTVIKKENLGVLIRN